MPIATLATVALPATPAGARGVHGRSAPLRRSVAADADALATIAARPTSGVFALDWEPGNAHQRRWSSVLDPFLWEIGAGGLSAAPPVTRATAAGSRSAATGAAATVTRTVTVTATSSASSSAPSGLAPIAGVSTTGASTTAVSTTAVSTASPLPSTAGAPVPAAAPSDPAVPGSQAAPHTPSGPLLTILPLPTSLSHALKKGLSVRYSVDRQVAGYFELLMSRPVARRLHIHGEHSRWLQGAGRGQTLIAYRLLVTTRGAHGRIELTIPSKAAARLRSLAHLTLTLRVMVRDAARRKPKIVHLQSVITLKGPAAIHAIHTRSH